SSSSSIRIPSKPRYVLPRALRLLPIPLWDVMLRLAAGCDLFVPVQCLLPDLDLLAGKEGFFGGGAEIGLVKWLLDEQFAIKSPPKDGQQEDKNSAWTSSPATYGCKPCPGRRTGGRAACRRATRYLASCVLEGLGKDRTAAHVLSRHHPGGLENGGRH
ncbi:MAG: hypothetical protein L6R35_003080, partial [Caloplaca aegaea]